MSLSSFGSIVARLDLNLFCCLSFVRLAES